MKFCEDGLLRSDNLITEETNVDNSNIVTMPHAKYIFVENAEYSEGDSKVFDIFGPQLCFEPNYVTLTNLICKLYVGAGADKKIHSEYADLSKKNLKIFVPTLMESLINQDKECSILFIYNDINPLYGCYRINDRNEMISAIEQYCAIENHNKIHSDPEYNMYMDYMFTLPAEAKDGYSEDEDEFNVFMQLMLACGIDYDDAMAYDNIRFIAKFTDDNKYTCEVKCSMTLEVDGKTVKSIDLFTTGKTEVGPGQDKSERTNKLTEAGYDAEKLTEHVKMVRGKMANCRDEEPVPGEITRNGIRLTPMDQMVLAVLGIDIREV